MKIVKNILAISVFATLTTSCFKLDQSPYEQLAETDAFKTKEDARAWTTGMYKKLRDVAYGNQMFLPEVYADLLNATVLAQESTLNVHRWETFTPSNGEIQSIWANSYSAIADINLALDNFDKIPVEDEVTHHRGELHLGRAYHYSYLAMLFCKAYDESSATTDLGLPLVTNYTKEIIPRSSLQKTYEFILEDLDKAETFLEGKVDDSRNTFTQDAAKALKARVLLFMGQWKDAYKYATDVINSGYYPLGTSQQELEDTWYNDEDTESITQLFAQNISAEQPSYTPYFQYVTYVVYRGEIVAYNPMVIPTQAFLDLYEAGDFRKAVYFIQKDVYNPMTGTGDPYYLVNKFPGNQSLRIGSSATYAHSEKIFRIGELYAIAAEAAYKNNDAANASVYLNNLKTARGASNVALSGDALYKEIQDERTRELAFEGFRMMDLKRWKQGVVRGTPQIMSFIFTDPANQFHQLNKPATDPKMVWPIPSVEVALDPTKVQQNPGWIDSSILTP